MPDTLTDTGTLWLSVSELAKRKGVTKQTMSERIGKLAADGKLEIRQGAHRAKLVNLVQYDLVVGDVMDLAKTQAAATVRSIREGAARNEESGLPFDGRRMGNFGAAQAERAQYEAELKKLELAERRGQLVAISQVASAVNRIGEAIIQVIERLPLRAAEIAGAATNDGEMGVRVVLKAIVIDTRAAIAEALRGIEREGLAEEERGPIAVDLPD